MSAHACIIKEDDTQNPSQDAELVNEQQLSEPRPS